MVNLPFKLQPRRKFSVECPECAVYRKKKGSKSLQVFRDPDGYVRWQCLHAGQCTLNERQYAKDPNPEEINNDLTNDSTYSPVIARELLDNSNLDKVYWYHDEVGNVTFGVLRLDTATGKLFVPVRQLAYEDRLVWGKGVTYPEGKTLFGLQGLNKTNKVLVVEGEKAALAADAIFNKDGITKVAVVTWRGGAQSIANGDWELLSGKTVYLWPDNDTPGQMAMDKIAAELPLSTVYMVDVSDFPPKSDLADELDGQTVAHAIKDAKLLHAPKGDQHMSFDELMAQNEFLNKKIPFSWPELSPDLNWPSSGVVVIEGRTKHGKSATAVNMAVKHLLEGHTITYFSYEIPASRVLARFARALDYTVSDTEVFRSKAMDQLRPLIGERLIIYDQSVQLNLTDLCKILDDPKLNKSFVIIDYAQIVPLAGYRDRYQALKDLMDRLRVLSNKHGYLIFLLSQLTPNYDNPLYDAPREAKDIHFSAEMVVRVWFKNNESGHPHYDEIPGNFILHILLNRDGASGQQFGFAFHKGVYLEPNGHSSESISRVVRKDRTADALETIVELIRDSKGVF